MLFLFRMYTFDDDGKENIILFYNFIFLFYSDKVLGICWLNCFDTSSNALLPCGCLVVVFRGFGICWLNCFDTSSNDLLPCGCLVVVFRGFGGWDLLT